MKPLVIYHDNCTDGFGAAFAAWLKLGDEAEYVPQNYGSTTEPLPAVDGREVYILDFSYPRAWMDLIFARARRVVWLDHHKTAFEMWGVGTDHRFMWSDVDEACLPRNRILLNNNKSGALLAWEYFNPDTKVPKLIQHIDDRDRWQFKLEGSKELHAVLQSYKPWSFDLWQNLLVSTETMFGHILSAGKAVLRTQVVEVARLAQQSIECWIPNYNVDTDIVQKHMDKWELPRGQAVAEMAESNPLIGLVVNSAIHESELGHALATQSGTYGLVWYLKHDGRVKCSLRSSGDYDVSAIAKMFGGGGHKNAAGFEIDIHQLISWLHIRREVE